VAEFAGLPHDLEQRILAAYSALPMSERQTFDYDRLVLGVAAGSALLAGILAKGLLAAPPAEPANPATTATTQDPASTADATTTASEEAAVKAQIDNFEAQPIASEPVPETTETNPKPVEKQAVITESLATEAPTPEIDVKEAPANNEATTSKDTKLAEAVNDLVKETEAAPEAQADEPSDGDNVPIAHKKVIEPISDNTPEKAPDLSELAAKEEQKDALSAVATPTTPPVASVVQPGGATVTPASSDNASTDTPGNVITPTGAAPADSGEHPADLAL